MTALGRRREASRQAASMPSAILADAVVTRKPFVGACGPIAVTA
jgi:hypothetical protein